MTAAKTQKTLKNNLVIDFIQLFPLDGARRFRRHVIDHAVNAIHLVHYAGRHMRQELMAEGIAIGGHAVA